MPHVVAHGRSLAVREPEGGEAGRHPCLGARVVAADSEHDVGGAVDGPLADFHAPEVEGGGDYFFAWQVFCFVELLLSSLHSRSLLQSWLVLQTWPAVLVPPVDFGVQVPMCALL